MNCIVQGTLTLNLKGEWYDMIDKGIKKEEYREIKDFYTSRLFLKGDIHYLNYDYGFKNMREEIKLKIIKLFLNSQLRFKVDKVKFVYGYTNKTMTFKIDDIVIGTGKEEWGAEKDKEYYVIKLGERYED